MTKTPTGRPPGRPPGRKYDRWIQVRVTEEEHARFAAAAAAKKWPLGKLVRELLKHSAAQLIRVGE